MEFFLMKDGRLKIALTKPEAENLPVSLDLFDLSCAEARRMMVGFLERAKSETGFSPRDSKLFVEICPDKSGGYALYFTVLDRKAGSGGLYRIKPLVFAFKNADDLLSGCVETARLYGHRIIDSSLYRYRERYMLIVYPLDYSDRLSSYLLGEYAKKTGDGDVYAAHIAEHGKAIIGTGALEIMAKHFDDS
ncbi:MAG: adaptor protein MecA [Oscillospiraceae bacterium]|nr:adaptor protein MecA [Oscillospiraceae bacterium]